jgi:hypothetical protein
MLDSWPAEGVELRFVFPDPVHPNGQDFPYINLVFPLSAFASHWTSNCPICTVYPSLPEIWGIPEGLPNSSLPAMVLLSLPWWCSLQSGPVNDNPLAHFFFGLGS